MQAAIGDPIVRGPEGAGGCQLTGAPSSSPPPFLGQKEFDGYSVTAICARRWHSVIYTRCSH